jgi:hypothetical protein
MFCLEMGRERGKLQEAHQEGPNAELDTPSRGNHRLLESDDDLGANDAVVDVGRVGEDRGFLLRGV